MKKLLLSLIASVVWMTSYAQYFGSAIFKEGFDNEAALAGWVQENKTASDLTLWKIGENDPLSFTNIDETSTASAVLALNSTDTKLTLTSPEIDLTGKANLQIGFYGYDLYYCLDGGVDFRFRITKDNGATWEDLFKKGDNYRTETVEAWNVYKYALPSQFDGAKVRLQFYVDASTMFSNPRGLEGYIDGIFISERPEIEPEIISINYSMYDKDPSTDAYGKEEPITIGFTNNGSKPITSIGLYYQINDNPEIVETYIPEIQIESGGSGEYTFSQRADLSAPLASFTVKAGVRMDGDYNAGNNLITGYAQNLTAGIPYVPAFIEREGGRVTGISDDEWTTETMNKGASWSSKYEMKNKDYVFYWRITPQKKEEACDAYLISRPVWLDQGVNYSILFDAYNIDKEAETNKMAVYVTSDISLQSPLTEIWRNEAIDTENALGSSAGYVAPETGIYYFAFRCISPVTAGEMRMDNISVTEVMGSDASVDAIMSPVDRQFIYGNAETVEVVLRNLGSVAIPANTLKVNMRLNDGKTVTETLPKALEPKEKCPYTFIATVDFSDLNAKRLLSVWTALPEDMNSSNDTISIDYVCQVTGIPYIPDFGTSQEKSEEVSFWSVANTNEDYYMFTANPDTGLDTYVFSYGGGMTTGGLISIENTDDQIYSRPMYLETGSPYKLSFLSRIGKNGAEMPISVNIYKVDENGKTFVKNIWTGKAASTMYEENRVEFTVAESGIYEVQFSVVTSEVIDFKLYLGMFRFTKVYDVDLSLEKIVMPTANLSCYNTFPVGAVVKNEGKERITAFSLKAVSPSVGEVKKDFNGITLEPNDAYLVYFDKDLTFNGTDAETISMSVTVAGDGNEVNDRKTMELKYAEPEAIPYTPNPFIALTSWSVINGNKDAYRFVPVKSGTVGFQYIGSKEVEANDILATPCLNFEREVTYSLDFKFGVNAGDTAAIDVYAYDPAADKRVDIVRLESIVKGAQYLGYFTVPENGTYTICFRPLGKTPSLFVSASPAIQVVTGKPEVELKEITAPKGDAVYSAKEKLAVTFLNKGKLPLSGIPFTCKVGDKEYHSYYANYVPASDKDTYTMEFPEVDLYTPGEYTIQVTADVAEEMTPQDNTLTLVLKSLPVPDMAIVSFDAPRSGILSEEEAVTVSVKNVGKGVLTDIPLQCVVTSGEDYTKTLTGTVAGPVADGETVQYTFPEKINMYEERTYHFTVTSSLAGDVNEENNRLETSVASSSKNFDGGVTAILTPTDAILSENETVKITVKNYSEVDLFEVPVTADIIYLNSDAAQIQTLAGNIAEIKSGQSVDYTFTGTVSMKSVGKYRIKSYTRIDKDVNLDNDTCTVVVKCLKQDVGVIAIVSPESGEELGVQEVTIEVKNFGEAAVGNIPVSYQIGAMPQLGMIEETIEPGGTLVYTFPAEYEFVGYKKYTVTASTELEEDADPANDTCTKEVENIKGNDISSVVAGRMSIYPNPSAGQITVTADSDNLQTILICNMQGMILQRYDGINASAYRMNLNLPEGSYIVRGMNEAGVSTYKLILKK